MRFADLVVNCLKETFKNDDFTLNVAKLRDGSLASTSDYAPEINNVCLSINKAISRLQTAGKIALKHGILTGDDEQSTYDISSLSDIRKIRSVYIMKNGKPYWVGWSQIGANTIHIGYGIDSTIHIIYERKIPNFTEDDFESEIDIETEYGLTDELCNYICYFVKSELFEVVDPDRCKRYLNYFEQFISEIDTRETIPYQSAIKPTYKI